MENSSFTHLIGTDSNFVGVYTSANNPITSQLLRELLPPNYIVTIHKYH